VVILSDAAWRGQFAGDRSIVGRDITINARPYRVIGVMPPGFRFPSPDVQVWLPFEMEDGIERVRRPHYLRPIARLTPGVTIEQARDDVRRIAAALEREYPDTNTKMGVDLGPLHEWVVGDIRRPLLVFLGAVAAVLLVACANLANLFLARASGRRREFAIRAALGSEGWRIARQLVVESALLAVAGGLLGIVVARAVTDALVALSPAGIPRLDEVTLHPQVFAFVALLTSLAAVLFGMMPALQSARPEITSLRDTTTTRTGRPTTRRALVVAQVAASCALVFCAGLFLRSFSRLESVPPGFDARDVLTFRVSLPGAMSETDEAAPVRFFESLLDRVRRLPGVAAAGGSTVLGLTGAGWTGDLFIEGRPNFHGRQLRHKDVTPGYFRAIGLQIVQGRDINAADGAEAPPITVVNQAFVRSYFPRDNPIGKRISFSYDPRNRDWATIVGVVRDERQDGLGEPVHPEAYGTLRQNPTSAMAIAVRTTAPASSIVPEIRAELRALSPLVAMFDVRTLDQVVSESIARERFTTWIVGLFAALALIIAAIGVYGVVTYSVSRRTQEIGVRVALGATRREVTWLVLREALQLVGVGLLAGLGLSLLAGRAVAALLFQTPPTDAVTCVTVIVVLASVGLLASVVPVRRALAVEPVVALRTE
jgi:putative ABC transport system permease protein